MLKRTSLFFFLGWVFPILSFGYNPKTFSFESIYGQSSNQEKEIQIAHNKTIELAKLLDKGRYKGELIRNTNVFNFSDKEYYVVATLGNGLSIKMYADLLKEASEKGLLVLPENRLLIFKNPIYNDFDVFDKSAFYAQAVQAQYFTKIFPNFDLLENHSFVYRIKHFSFHEKSKKPYSFHLFNGTQVDLSYQEAYWVWQNNQLSTGMVASPLPIFTLPFELSKIESFNKIPYEIPIEGGNEVRPFGVLFTFDQPIPLQGKDFPILFLKKDGRFSVNFVVPNLVVEPHTNLKKVKPAEFVEKWQILANPQEKYTVVRGYFLDKNFDESSFLSHSPQVYVHPDRKHVFFTFFQEVNQTYSYKNAKAAEEILNKNKELAANQIKPYQDKRNQQFYFTYNEAIQVHNQALNQENAQNKKMQLKQSIDKFRVAAHYTKTDEEAQLVLKGIHSASTQLYKTLMKEDLYSNLEEKNFTPQKFNSLEALLLEIAQYAPPIKNQENLTHNVRMLFQMGEKIKLLQEMVLSNFENVAEEKENLKVVFANLENNLKSISYPDPKIQEMKKWFSENLSKLKLRFLKE